MIPKVSVVITTFRRPTYLRGAIASVLKQDFKNFEVIVVNDDPTDVETDKVISSFSDSRIIYIKNKKNLGSAKSLNVGLETAKGEYAAILDDDDVWASPEKLKKQADFLDKNREHVLVGTNMIVVDAGSGKEIIKSRIPAADEELRRLFFKNNPFAHSSVMFKRKVAVSLGGYDETLPRGKDYDLWLKLAKKGKVAVLPDYFLKYREASFENRNLVKQRYEDAKWTLEVMRRHRREFSNTFLSYLRQWSRYIVFRIILKAPFIYKFFKRIRSF
ncbi:MAG: glycosyltransferase [Candidatus Jorgensenbacteria bacterium]